MMILRITINGVHTMTSIFALFPGQGSQKVGMGKELCEAFPIAKELFAQADAALGFSLSQICFEGPLDKLTLTEIAQPAILTVSTICFRLFQESSRAADTTIVSAAGHSLGEYSALVAADALSFEDAVRLVNKRGKYMQEAVPVGTGRMVAVLGKEVAEIEAALPSPGAEIAQIANINAPGQIVVAGSTTGVQEFITKLGAAKVVELTVSAPFHCNLMKPAEERLRVDLANVEIRKPKFPVYQNYTAQASNDPEVIRENLALQVCGRVRWVECVTHAVASHKPASVWEFGAGNVLTGLVKRIDSTLARVNVDSPGALQAA
jgi:[acyl-carrier-protein] S-malonyltransferase